MNPLRCKRSFYIFPLLSCKFAPAINKLLTRRVSNRTSLIARKKRNLTRLRTRRKRRKRQCVDQSVCQKSRRRALFHFSQGRLLSASPLVFFFLPLTRPVWKGSSQSFPQGAFQQNLFPARTSYSGSVAEEDLQRSKEEAVLLRFWLWADDEGEAAPSLLAARFPVRRWIKNRVRRHQPARW
jgi:hypothetical protein